MTSILECRKVHRYFGGLTALCDVDLQVEEGSILGIIGPNGAGKTTLFNIISGALTPTMGQVFFQGRDISGLGANRICRLGIARTYQLVRPFASLTALENVLVGVGFGRATPMPRSQRVGTAMAELEFVGLADKAEHPAESLTLVERKHLEIARALGTDPKLLLLDEVVSGLSPTECLVISKTIRDIQGRGITVIMIEHVLKVVMELCQAVMVLHFGSRLAYGPPAEIVQNREVIEAYLGDDEPSYGETGA
jgi:branched-chain amino acid transport system ATP-binding protein